MAQPRSFVMNPDVIAKPYTVYRDAWKELDIDEETVYLITWNPKPAFYNYDQGGENNFDLQWWTMCKTLMKSIRCLNKYAFVPEVSEQGKLHMHGFLTVKDKRKYLRSFIPTLRKNGFIKVCKARSGKWKTFKYHVKDLQSGVTEELMVPAVLTHYTCEYLRRYYAKEESMVPVFDKNEKPRKSIMVYFTDDVEFSMDESFSL